MNSIQNPSMAVLAVMAGLRKEAGSVRPGVGRQIKRGLKWGVGAGVPGVLALGTETGRDILSGAAGLPGKAVRGVAEAMQSPQESWPLNQAADWASRNQKGLLIGAGATGAGLLALMAVLAASGKG